MRKCHSKLMKLHDQFNYNGNFLFLNLSDCSPAAKQQTDPPTVPISELFPDGNFPEGQILSYKDE